MSNFWNNVFHKFSIPKSNFGRQENEKCSIVLAIKAEWPILKTAVLEAFLVSSDTTLLQVNRTTMENIKHAKEAVTVIEASTSQEVEDELEMVQEMDAVEDIEYDLVEDAEEDSHYKSNFDSEKEDSNDILIR